MFLNAVQLMEAHARAARAQLQRAGSAPAIPGEMVEDDGGVLFQE